MGKNNQVIAGKYSGCSVDLIYGNVYIQSGKYSTLDLNKQNITSYELIDKNDYRPISSRIIRGAVGRIILGPVGMIAGATMPKNEGSYLVSVKYNDGEESLMELSRKYYKALVQAMY